MSEARDASRWRWLGRPLQVALAATGWAALIVPISLSVLFPWLVAPIAVACGLYWFIRVAWCTAAGLVVAARIRRVSAVRWTDRLASLADRPARRETLLRQLVGLPRPGAALGISALALAGAARRRATEELDALDAVDRLGTDPPPADAFVHVALIPTDTEPLHTLRQTIRAVADADWPAERKVCAVITRREDEGGRANVETLRSEFARSFAAFLHFEDPGDPGIAVGKRSAMAFGGRRLYRILVRERGIDPDRILVTQLDPDIRVHPEYFGHLTWRHLTAPDRDTAVYQPIPQFGNGLWQAPLPLRLLAAALTQLQMWRGVLPARLQGFGCYAMPLRLLHRIGYWATDAVVEDGRLSSRGYLAYGARFRAVPLFIGVSADAGRARAYWRSLAGRYLRVRRWAWEAGESRFLIDGLVSHPEIPLRSRAGRLLLLLGERLTWAAVPVVLAFGLIVPFLPIGAVTTSALGRQLPLIASTLLTTALVLSLASIWVAWRFGPAMPGGWGLLHRGFSSLGWIGMPVVAVFFSLLPAIDAEAQPLTGRYRVAPPPEPGPG